MKKLGLRLTGRRKWYFLIFIFSLYANFKWLLWKSYNGFLVFLVISATSQISLIYTFVTMKQRHFNFFWSLHGYAFCFFNFFQNERNITTSLLMIHLKCTAVHYANLNSSSKNKPVLNYGLLNMLFRFFQFLLFVFILVKLLSKKLMKQLPFLIQISKIHFKM